METFLTIYILLALTSIAVSLPLGWLFSQIIAQWPLEGSVTARSSGKDRLKSVDDRRKSSKTKITVYQYAPAWGLPDVSPHVTKVITYLEMTGTDYEVVRQDPKTLLLDAPQGKLPYIVDQDGTKVYGADTIIDYLKTKYGDPLDADLTPAQKADEAVWNRLLDEDLFWSGVILPRSEQGWETYIPYIVKGADVIGDSELRLAIANFREMIINEFDDKPMGQFSKEKVYELATRDLKAISDHLGNKAYFFGENPHSIDASIYSWLTHIMDAPFTSPAKKFGLQQKNLVIYCERMRHHLTG